MNTPTSTHPEAGEREAFEVWCQAGAVNTAKLTDPAYGPLAMYADSRAHAAWLAWQAGRAALAAKAPEAAPGQGEFSLTRSIIDQCPALKLPQTWWQKLGNCAQIVPLKGLSNETAQALVDRLNAAPSPAAPVVPQTGMVTVCREDANAYCQILTVLGMEEEGDAVAEVKRLKSRQPLSLARINELMDAFESHERVTAWLPQPIAFVRAIEVAHEIAQAPAAPSQSTQPGEEA